MGFDPDELLRMAASTPRRAGLRPQALGPATGLHHAEVAIYPTATRSCPQPDLIDAADHAVVLVPHILELMPRDGRLPDEPGLLGAGMYNGGLVAQARDRSPS